MAQRTSKQQKPVFRFKGLSLVTWIVLIIAAIIGLWPMYWLFVTAFTPATFAIKTPPDILPIHADFSNFQRLFSTAADYWSWAGNSLIIALTITLFHIIFDTLAGYAFAKKQFPGKNLLFWLLIGTMMIPSYVTFIPMYIVTQNVGLLDTLWAVILPGFAGVFGIFLLRQYIQTIPTELIEAARMDGCGELRIFWYVIAPLAKPAIAAQAIMTFVQHWNDFFWPLIVLQSSNNYTLPVGVAGLQGEFAKDYGIIFAGAALAAIPMVVFFMLFQRYFLSGVRIGAVKG